MVGDECRACASCLNEGESHNHCWSDLCHKIVHFFTDTLESNDDNDNDDYHDNDYDYDDDHVGEPNDRSEKLHLSAI